MTIAGIFDEAQLEAIVKMGKDSVMNRSKSTKYFEAARLYKVGKLKEKKIKSSKSFNAMSDFSHRWL